MNQLMDPNQTGENVYVRYSSTGIPIACVYGPWKPVPVPPKQARRARRLLKKHKLLGDPPPCPKPRVVDLCAWEAKRKPVVHKPPTFRTVKARVMYTDADGSTVDLEPLSITVFDSSAIVSEAEVEVGSVSKSPAEDDSTMIGGSVLKRPHVDLGKASQALVANLNPGQDSSSNGTLEEVKEGVGNSNQGSRFIN